MAEREPSVRQFTLDDALGVDTTGFMDLKDPDYAYMFGFLQADGHLSQQSRQRGRLTVEINARDIDILRKFQKLTPYNSTISARTRTTNFAENSHTAIWTLCSLEARSKLNELGLPYGRKSRTIAPPHGKFSSRDYLRGVIDADGSVGYSQSYPFISLTTASTPIMAYMCSYAEELTGAERRLQRNQRDGIYNIMYITEAAKSLVTHLYYPGCLALARKQTAAASVTAWKRPAGSKPRPPRIEWSQQMDRTLLAAPTIADAAAILGYSWSACQVRRSKLLHGRVTLPD
ncbi:LAGLIDADG family homing endonuclease [Streptomyces sp. NPDC005474]|uniref:LAGLIDADG family homing endonuclease n=1 Tax=Streptomyces sp. NPDC005474 TaxID=3154878 RepID=UPI0034538301